MAYPEQGSHLSYFIPNIPLALNAAEVLKEVDIGASSGDHGELICIKPCHIKRFQFTLTGEAASGTVTAPTVIFTKRPTPLSATGESVVCTLTIPSGGAIGKTYYKDVDVAMAVGDSIEVSWTVGSGTPTGMGCYSFVCHNDPEVAGNNSDMVASA